MFAGITLEISSMSSLHIQLDSSNNLKILRTLKERLRGNIFDELLFLMIFYEIVLRQMFMLQFVINLLH